ncbi:MAG: hypothetical protein JOY92_12650 [Verrucomicrobia bacterium]|nr:hypothetical protein [Verrucomicrobiota bacterium]
MFQTSPGRPQPLGATVTAEGVDFSLFSQNATKVELLLFQDPADPEPVQVIAMPAPTLFYWHVHVDGLAANTAYAYRVYGPGGDAVTKTSGHRFNGNKVLIDPYARGNVDALWDANAAKDGTDNVATSMRSIVIDAGAYDWEGDAPLNVPFTDTVVYELHPRGFTASPSSGVAHPGHVQRPYRKVALHPPARGHRRGANAGFRFRRKDRHTKQPDYGPAVEEFLGL